MLDYNNLAYAYGKPIFSGVFKNEAQDFKVDEQLGFPLTSSGEHLFLRIEKQGINTEELVKRVAKLIHKPVKNISYAGLKDRLAITTQWLSIHCPGEEIPNAGTLSGEGWRVIESARHLKKLKTGGLSGNQFTIVIRQINPSDALDTRLQDIKTKGVPNYFGPQRFGHNGQNILKAEKMLIGGQRVKDRFFKGLYYSCARSFLYNRILSQRVLANNWNQAVAGDVMQLAGSHSIFTIEIPDETIINRVLNLDVSPASVLYGIGNEKISKDALIIQQNALAGLEAWCEALKAHGLELAYRAHVLTPANFSWEWCDETSLRLSFELPAGAYATSVLREIII